MRVSTIKLTKSIIKRGYLEGGEFPCFPLLKAGEIFVKLQTKFIEDTINARLRTICLWAWEDAHHIYTGKVSQKKFIKRLTHYLNK